MTLTDLAQAYYREIYGGPDSSPMNCDEFTPPRGAFFVGYLGADPVAMGGLEVPCRHYRMARALAR